MTYNIGDIVYMKSNPVSTGESTKLQSRYKGPLCITRVLPGDTYGVTDLLESRGKKFTTTAHVSQLKLWKNRLVEDDCLSDESIENPITTEVAEKIEENRPKRERKLPKKLEDYVI